MKLYITLLFSIFIGSINAQQWNDISSGSQFSINASSVTRHALVVLDNGKPVVAHTVSDVSNLVLVDHLEWK